MRKIHRWLSVIFAALLLWIGSTGLLSQVGKLVNDGGFEEEMRPMAAAPAPAANALIPAAQAHDETPPPAVVAPPAAFTCPADMTCRPKRVPRPGEWNVSYLHHLHSGEEFGPAGVILSMASGLALLFFAFSGLWMYIEMFRRRAHRKSHPRRLFW